MFPFLAIFFLGNLLYHLVQNKALHSVRFPDDNQENDIHSIRKLKVSTVNMSIYLMIVCSYMIVIYIVILDCIAVFKRTFLTEEEIFFYPTADLSQLQNKKTITKLELEYGIPFLMLVEDLLVLVMMVILSLVKLLFHSRISLKWYNIIIGPLFCIIIHSYHILVGFVHTPHHATSILVFYALILITFIVTLKSAYHNMFKFCRHCFHYASDSDTRDREPTSRDKVAHFCVLFFLFCISVFVGLTFIYIAFLFILVPINNVIENAPDRILNINQTILILFGAAITFKGLTLCLITWLELQMSILKAIHSLLSVLKWKHGSRTIVNRNVKQ